MMRHWMPRKTALLETRYLADNGFLLYKTGQVSYNGGVADLRILIIADDPLARAGLATLLASQPGCIIAGQIAGDANLREAREVYLPEIVLWDVGLSPSASVERLGDLRDAGLPVVALLADDTNAADVWSAGARGILSREASAETIVSALRAVTEGLAVFDPNFALLPSRSQPTTPLTEELTPREREVLQLLAEGQSNKEIARRLGISEHTVKFHVNAILGKLNAQSRTEAVVRATRLGLVLL